MESFFVNNSQTERCENHFSHDHGANHGCHLCHASNPDDLYAPDFSSHDPCGLDHNVRCDPGDHENHHPMDQPHNQLMTLPIQKVKSLF